MSTSGAGFSRPSPGPPKGGPYVSGPYLNATRPVMPRPSVTVTI